MISKEDEAFIKQLFHDANRRCLNCQHIYRRNDYTAWKEKWTDEHIYDGYACAKETWSDGQWKPEMDFATVERLAQRCCSEWELRDFLKEASEKKLPIIPAHKEF
jgi:hypothetical protein